MQAFLSIWYILTNLGAMLQVVMSQCSYGTSPFTTLRASGSIRSHGYPKRYFANEHCEWRLLPRRSAGNFEMIQLDIEVDTHMSNSPTRATHCEDSRDRVEFGHIFGCGKEKSTCFVFMLNSSDSLDCHAIFHAKYLYCHFVLLETWPFTVSFQTEQQEARAGFSMNYTFIDCGAEANKTKRGKQTPTSTITIRTPSKMTRSSPESPRNHHDHDPRSGDSTSWDDNMKFILGSVIAVLLLISLALFGATLRRQSQGNHNKDNDSRTNTQIQNSSINGTGLKDIPSVNSMFNA